MKLFQLGSLGRYCRQDKGDPLGYFYDAGTMLRLDMGWNGTMVYDSAPTQL